MKEKNTLKLVLKDIWFEKIKAGVKTHEYREYKDYWIKRLSVANKYSYVEFQKAYRKNPERMKFEIKSVSVLDEKSANDLNINSSVFDIELGKRIY